MSQKTLLFVHLILFCLLSIIAVFTPGTGGGGDSLAHFFISEISWFKKEFFFHHWGKPFFILFSSGFAQLGFIGIKIFNVLCGTLSSYVSFLVAKKLNLKLSWFIPFIAFTSPVYYVYLLSGYTEPFSALICISSVWLLLTERNAAGFILCSFLPFCRSEAQIFLFFFGVYAVLNHKWRYLPLLLVGSLAYSLLGRWLYFDSFLWIFDIPYKSGPSPYGSGPWWHYINRFYHMLALPGLLLLLLGLIQFVRKLFIQPKFWQKEALLIHAMFLSLVIAHSVVWALGIYASAGLERVLIVVFPFAWIIMLDGLSFITEVLPFRAPLKVMRFFAVFFFLIQIKIMYSNPTARFYRNTVTQLSPEDELLRSQVVPYIKTHYPDISLFIVEKPYLAVCLGINPMDGRYRGDWDVLHQSPIQLPKKKALFIWDNHFPLPQYNASLELAQMHPQLKEVKQFTSENDWQFVLFEYTEAD